MTVAIIMGSPSDRAKMQGAADILQEFGIPFEVTVLSAHRSPELVTDYVKNAPIRGIRLFICGAGMAAHLAGCVAGQTWLPVIGVPLSGSTLGGEDALFSTVQMPKGIPVAAVAIDGSYNAGLLAVQMLALHDALLTQKLKDFKQHQAETIKQANGWVQ